MRPLERPSTRAELPRHTEGDPDGYAEVAGAVRGTSSSDASAAPSSATWRASRTSPYVVDLLGDTLVVRVRGEVDPAMLELFEAES